MIFMPGKIGFRALLARVQKGQYSLEKTTTVSADTALSRIAEAAIVGGEFPIEVQCVCVGNAAEMKHVCVVNVTMEQMRKLVKEVLERWSGTQGLINDTTSSQNVTTHTQYNVVPAVGCIFCIIVYSVSAALAHKSTGPRHSS
eukprot:m.352625 g.352625  ORF g.352625 m.352625 type:complete len:143 (-) comp16570_c0_seq1:272-700(-)